MANPMKFRYGRIVFRQPPDQIPSYFPNAVGEPDRAQVLPYSPSTEMSGYSAWLMPFLENPSSPASTIQFGQGYVTLGCAVMRDPFTIRSVGLWTPGNGPAVAGTRGLFLLYGATTESYGFYYPRELLASWTLEHDLSQTLIECCNSSQYTLSPGVYYFGYMMLNGTSAWHYYMSPWTIRSAAVLSPAVGNNSVWGITTTNFSESPPAVYPPFSQVMLRYAFDPLPCLMVSVGCGCQG